MRAMILREHGGLDQMTYVTDFPDPEVGVGDVLVQVGASSLNYHDIFTMRGMPGIKIKMPAIMGLDVAGTIVEVGPEVEGWKVGDRVLVDPVNRVEGGLIGETVYGGLAELCCVKSHQLMPLPDDISFEHAAALPVAYATAVRMMYRNGGVSSGERVLALGASGGVGVCCVMLAKLAGAEVIACASSDAKLEKLKEIGADHLINYSERDFVKEVHARFGKPHRRGQEGGVDVVVNYTGGDTWVKSLKCLKVGGRMLTCGATAGFDPVEDIRYIWTFELKILGSNGFKHDDLEQTLDLVHSGKLKVLIDKVYNLEDAKEGLKLIENREVLGKVVIKP